MLPLLLAATVTPTTVEFRAGDHLVTRYHTRGDGLAKPYCYPVNAPDGTPLTRAWPLEPAKPGGTTDHVHQKSLWFCHGDVIPEGLTWSPKSPDKHVKGIDFWSEQKGHGRIVCESVGEVRATPDSVAVPTVNRWLTPDGQAILREERTISLRRLKGVADPVLQFDIALTALVPVTFGDTKEGSFGLRVADEFRLERKGSAGVVASSSGRSVKAGSKDPLPLWGERAAWHDYSGEHGGVAIFDAPTNPAKAAWHTRAYGLMAANPFARAGSGFPGLKGAKGPPVKLAKGETLRLRYGVYPHAKGADVAAAYGAWE